MVQKVVNIHSFDDKCVIIAFESGDICTYRWNEIDMRLEEIGKYHSPNPIHSFVYSGYNRYIAIELD